MRGQASRRVEPSGLSALSKCLAWISTGALLGRHGKDNESRQWERKLSTEGANTSKSQDATVIEGGPRDGREEWKRAVITVAMIASTILRRRYSGHARSDGERDQTAKVWVRRAAMCWQLATSQ